ncbi:hypothetical protein [Bradyrhizobium cosmicum]|uniref:hypothetical protein n=1 Tax=Bradyrhizobium cosmicum TaxID=1404864 RepID=UPI0011649174|nr:hypothetical protein [Bradyrhizobium cosmicum]QDP20673.1 hypothetical protein FNV92_00240 [Bradyrhizobium cosmicum]
MSIQLSVAARNARLDAIETAIGTAAKLQMYTGSMPASCATAASGTKLLEDTLASDWAANASSGSKSFNGTPIAGTALAGGTAGYFRIVDSAGTTCHMQGTITATGGGGDMTIDNTSIANGQTVNVTSFTLTDGNA